MSNTPIVVQHFELHYVSLQELLAIQQQGPRAIGFFGTRNMGFMHQELIEILSYAMVINVSCYFTQEYYMLACRVSVLYNTIYGELVMQY